MYAFIKTLVICSVIMSVIAMITLLALPVTSKKYSPKTKYYIWLFIMIGFVIPFRPQLDVSILSDSLPAVQPVMSLPIQMMDRVMMNVPDEQILTQDEPLGDNGMQIPIYLIVGAIWFVGMAFIIIYNIYRHVRFMQVINRWTEDITDERILLLLEKVKTEMGITQPIAIQQTGCISSPMLLGLIAPRILLPSTNFCEDELYFILKHELVHYKHKDLWYKTLVLAAMAIHWFNPLIYILSNVIGITCEMSCDAEVVKSTTSDIRLRYTETILGVIRSQTRVKTALSTNFYGGKEGMKKRIFTIMDTTKKRAGAAMVCAVLIGTMGTSTIFASSAATAATGNLVNAQDKKTAKTYEAVQDGLKLTITRVAREKDMLYIYTTLADTTGSKFKKITSFMSHVKQSADVNWFGVNLEYDSENAIIGTQFSGMVDLSKGADKTTVIFDELVVNDVSYKGEWKFEIPIPAESWVTPRYEGFDKIASIGGLEIGSATLFISPEGDITFSGETKNIDRFNSKKTDSIEFIYQDGKKEKLKFDNFTTEAIDLEEELRRAQQFQYYTLPDHKGNTHSTTISFQRNATDKPLTLKEVQNIKSLSIDGIVTPLTQINKELESMADKMKQSEATETTTPEKVYKTSEEKAKTAAVK